MAGSGADRVCFSVRGSWVAALRVLVSVLDPCGLEQDPVANCKNGPFAAGEFSKLNLRREAGGGVVFFRDRQAIGCETQVSSMLETRVYAVLQPVRSIAPLIDQLTRTVAPESWEHVGGYGSIEAWPGGALVVAHTLWRHLEIEQAFGKVLKPIIVPAAKPRQVPAGGRSNPLVALQQPSGCDFIETRLDEAIESLAKQHRVVIRFDQESVSNERISLDRPLTLSLPPVSLESTLNLLLRQLHLTWTVREDSLVIISIHDEENYLLPITYNIAD